MVAILALWLPILLAAVLVFIASSILHMVLPFHRSDYAKLPGEGKLLEAMRKEGVGPGNYAFPWCASPKEMGSEEMTKKFTQGPTGMINITPSGPPAMGKYLTQWFIFCVVVSVFVAYLASRTVGPDAEYLTVFRVTGTAAFMSYGLGQIIDSIWKAQLWTTTAKALFDALIYSLLTAGAFGWLWP